jgi:hypothetical protein
MSTLQGFCACCQQERAHMANSAQLSQRICRVCRLHQDDDQGGWHKRELHHIQMWKRLLAEQDQAYMSELLRLERAVTRLRGTLKAAS